MLFLAELGVIISVFLFLAKISWNICKLVNSLLIEQFLRYAIIGKEQEILREKLNGLTLSNIKMIQKWK